MANQPTLLMMQAAPAGPDGVSAFLVGIAPWLFIFLIFSMLMIRPQQRRMKQHQAALAAAKKGDEVVTGGGIRGRITKVADDEFEVEIASGVRVRVIKSTVTAIVTTAPTRAND